VTTGQIKQLKNHRPEFLNLMTAKLQIVQDVLRLGFDVLLTDVDIVFHNNVIPVGPGRYCSQRHLGSPILSTAKNWGVYHIGSLVRGLITLQGTDTGRPCVGRSLRNSV